jgi:hypothetical protein
LQEAQDQSKKAQQHTDDAHQSSQQMK